MEDYKKRVEWIDYMRGISMIFVMISHATPPNSWVKFFSPFFLTSFFFISGYLFKLGDTFSGFLKRKIKSLIIPMICLSLVNGIVGTVFKGIPFKNRLYGILIQRAGISESLWFFPCLFITEILLYIIVKYIKQNYMIIVSSLIICMFGFIYIEKIGIPLFWQFEISSIMVFFMALGYLYKQYEKSLFDWNNMQFIIMFIIYIFICVIYDNPVNIHDEYFSNQFVFIVSAIIGILIILFISKKIKSCKILQYIGSHTIVFFSFQGFLLTTVRKVVISLNINSISLVCIISTVISAAILFIVSIGVYKYFPFAVGKFKK